MSSRRPNVGVPTGTNKSVLGVKNSTVENQYYIQRAAEATARRAKKVKQEHKGLENITEELELEIAKTLKYGALPLAHVARKHNVNMRVVHLIQENVWVHKYDKQLGVKR